MRVEDLQSELQQCQTWKREMTQQLGAATRTIDELNGRLQESKAGLQV